MPQQRKKKGRWEESGIPDKTVVGRKTVWENIHLCGELKQAREKATWERRIVGAS